MALGLALFLNVSLLTFVAMLVAMEERRGRRIVLARMRDALDGVVLRLGTRLAAAVEYVGRHVIQLSWYYSMNSFLRTLLALVVSLYDRLEARFQRNRVRARALRAERRALRKTSDNMLHAIALHKESTALSPAEKKRLRSKALERG